MKLRFTKMHGLGNDFVVIDGTRTPFHPEPALMAHLADRRLGVGCDQILVVDAAPAADVDFGYRIYNADGSESGQCGNGARCLARFIAERGISQRRRLRVRTLSSTLELERLDSGLVRVNMGVPNFEPAAIPLDRPQRAARYEADVGGEHIEFGAVSMGNPHAVIAVGDASTAPVASLAPLIQAAPLFARGVNVGFLEVIDAANARLRVYERGSGETPACGSGACAAMAVGRLWQRLGPQVRMRLNGGELTLEWAGEGAPLYMTGPAESVYEGELDWPQATATVTADAAPRVMESLA